LVPVRVMLSVCPCMPRPGETPVMTGGGGKILKLDVPDDPPGVETPIPHVATVPGSSSVAVAVVEFTTLTLETVMPTQPEILIWKGDPTNAVPLIVMLTLVPAIPDVGDIDVTVGVVFLT
jgi:hypothetical protein